MCEKIEWLWSICGNDTDGVKIKCSEKSLSYCQLVRSKIPHGLGQDWTRASAVRVRPCEPWYVQIFFRREIPENACISFIVLHVRITEQSMINSATLDILHRVTAASFTSVDSHRYFPDSYRSLYKIVWTLYVREDRLTLVICEETSAGFAYCDECVLCRKNYSRVSYYDGDTFSNIWL
jgi:hypothetical protein